MQSDGLYDAVKAAPELLLRQYIGYPIFSTLRKYGIIQSLSRDELFQRAVDIQYIGDGSSQPGKAEITPFVAELETGYVFPMTGLAMTTTGEFIEESVASPASADQFLLASLSRHLFFDRSFVRRALVNSNQESLGDVIEQVELASVIAPRHPNYYHWMVETVPRIRYLKKYEQTTGNKVTLIVPDTLPWVKETLELLDWPTARVRYGNNSIYQINRLVIPSFPNQQSADYQWLRNKMLPDSVTPQPEITNVYISRSNAIERRVVNERELVDTLSQYGFTRYWPEKHSMQTNLQVFYQADIILGPHGAGLTDLIFSDDGLVIELFGSKIKGPYKRLAAITGTDYESVKCQPESTDIYVTQDQIRTIIDIVQNQKNK